MKTTFLHKLKPDVNPIIVKELRSRMRGWRAFSVLTAVLLLLGGISYLLYRIVLSSMRYSTTPMSPVIGQTLFAGLAVVELLMICFITPAITAGSISGEQEKLTYEMLLATPLRPASILWGKLVSALGYVFLLILAAVPMFSLVFIFGGVALKEMAKTLIMLSATAVTLGVIGVFTSALLRRTVRATVLSYLIVLTLLAGPFIVYIFVGILRDREPPRWILVPNPVSALFSAVAPSMPGSGPSGMLGELGMFFNGTSSLMRGNMITTGIPRPLYHFTLPLYGALSLLLYLLSTRLVRASHRWRVRWQEIVFVLALFALLGGVVAVPFLLTAGRYEKIRTLIAPTPAPMSVPMMAPVVVEREVVRVVEVTPTPVPTQANAPVATVTPGLTQALEPSDRAAIYTAVIRQQYTVDHTFGEPPNFPIVYLVKTTDDSIGDPDAPHAEPKTLPAEIREAVVDALADLPAPFVWVDDRDEVPMDAHSTVLDGGVVMTLGNIHQQADGRTLVSASLYFAALGAGGQTYIVEQVDGSWMVVGNTGVQWIS
ncbi:MAG: ABC transporter permease subunit [Anaerolineae bacterium]|nr:ABC transporter permease subunit [Anaerolineae bacterium]